MHVHEAEDVEILEVGRDGCQIMALADLIVGDDLIWVHAQLDVAYRLTLESLLCGDEKLLEAELRTLCPGIAVESSCLVQSLELLVSFCAII